jgi:uncharacterized membrane protein YjfL (UPF0719 family)
MQLAAIVTILGQGAVYAVIAFLFIVATKKIDDQRTASIDDDHEIEEKSNLAVGLRRTGLYLGMAIALAGTLGGVSAGFAMDVLALVADGIVITVCLFVSRTVNDRVMLGHLENDNEVKKGNVAVGLSECGMFVATGFILNGSFFGTSENIPAGIASAVVFFVAGQAVLLIGGYGYERIAPFNVREEIRNGNAAAGMALAGMLIALGVILRSSIAGPSAGWAADFVSFGAYAVYGIVLLLIFKKAADLFLLPGTSIAVEVQRDRNVAAVALTEAGIIAVAIMIGSIM